MSREMKQSGIVEGFNIPLQWKTMKFGKICSVVTDFVASGSFADLRANVPYLSDPDYAMLVRTTDLAKTARSEGKVYISKESYEFLSNSNLFGGEIVLPNIGSIGDAYVVPKLYERMSLAPNAIMFKTHYCDKYYYYYFLSKIGKLQLDEISQSTAIAKFNKTDLTQLRVVLPSLSEQQKIASFLDRKCAEVDEMIALQEKIVEELKAYKQSVITEAVTKGLNPAVPMRDSGIEWIGQIPEHWEVRRIKFIGKAENGLTYTPNDVCDESEGTLVLRSSNIQNGKLAFDDNVYVRSVPDSLRVRVGDIIICSRNGSASLVGKSALVDSEIDASFGAFMMRFRSKHNHKFIHFLLTATISHYKQLFTTTTINQLTIGLINNIAMPFVENTTEKQAIADYLDEKCADIDSLIQTKQSKIDSLKEYKKSIIYEYVTGKREVE